MTSLRRLIGMPVIWQDRPVGCVERVLPQMCQHTIGGLVVRRGIGSARWCPGDTILALEADRIVVGRKPEGAPPAEQPAGQSVYLANGQWVGEVTDAILQNGSPAFAALEISAGPFYRLLGRCAYASDFGFDALSGSVVVPQLLTWAQLKRQLGEEDSQWT